MRRVGGGAVGRNRGADSVESGGGEDFAAPVAVEIGNLAGGAEVVVQRAERRMQARHVAGQGGRAEVRQVDRLVDRQVGPASNDVDGAGVDVAGDLLLVGADHDVVDPVAGDVAGPHPDAETVEGMRADQRGDRYAGRRRAQVEVLKRGRLIAQYLAADHDGEGTGSRAGAVRAVVLPTDEQVGDAVAGDVGHPDLAARHFGRAVAVDAQNARLRRAGVEAPLNRAVAEDEVDAAGSGAAQRAGENGGHRVVGMAVAVAVEAARDGHAMRSVARRAEDAAQAGNGGRDTGEIDRRALRSHRHGGGEQNRGAERSQEQGGSHWRFRLPGCRPPAKGNGFASGFLQGRAAVRAGPAGRAARTRASSGCCSMAMGAASSPG